MLLLPTKTVKGAVSIIPSLQCQGRSHHIAVPIARTASSSQLTRAIPSHSEADSPRFLSSCITPHTDICQKGSRLVRPFSVQLPYQDSSSHGALDRSCWGPLGVPFRTNQSREVQMRIACFVPNLGWCAGPSTQIDDHQQVIKRPVPHCFPFHPLCPTAAAHGKGMV